MPRTEIKVTPGYNSNGIAFLRLAEWLHTDPSDSLGFDVNEIAEYSLRYLSDTNEVVLAKGDKIIFSEVVS